MSWPGVFLGCFVVGFVLSVLAVALTAVGLHIHFHVPFVSHPHVPHVHLGDVAAAGVAPINFATLTAFLAWFGGTGYLLTSEFRWLTVPALLAAAVAGVGGSAIVFWLMARVLWSPHENMQSVDYRMVGVLGQISHSIRAEGTGELVYSRGGSRHSCAARSADGTAIDKGEEVVVTAYERGVAYVRRWDDLAEGRS
jgi:membrane-bound ClpP family serine protease